MRGNGSWTCGAALLAAGLALAGAAAAQDWKAEWDRTVAAANKEGGLTLTLGTNPQWRNFIVTNWEKEFPKIRIEVITMDMSQIMVRIEQERRQDRYLWDVLASGASGPQALLKKGVIAELKPLFILPEVKDEKAWGSWDAAFNDEAEKYVFRVGAYLKMPFYNAKLVPPEEVKAKGLDVLLNPAYKGKILWHAPWLRGSGRSFGWMLYKHFGEKGLADMILKQQVRFSRSQNDVAAAMARGQVAIAIGPPLGGLLEAYEKAGVKFDARPFGNTPDVAEIAPGGFNLAALTKPAHPNAQKVFVNWLLSKKTIAGLAPAVGLTLRRKDVPSPEDPALQPIPGMKYSEGQTEAQQAGSDKAAKFIRSLVEK